MNFSYSNNNCIIVAIWIFVNKLSSSFDSLFYNLQVMYNCIPYKSSQGAHDRLTCIYASIYGNGIPRVQVCLRFVASFQLA
jgi:hypothetical protein